MIGCAAGTHSSLSRLSALGGRDGAEPRPVRSESSRIIVLLRCRVPSPLFLFPFNITKRKTRGSVHTTQACSYTSASRGALRRVRWQPVSLVAARQRICRRTCQSCARAGCTSVAVRMGGARIGSGDIFCCSAMCCITWSHGRIGSREGVYCSRIVPAAAPRKSSDDLTLLVRTALCVLCCFAHSSCRKHSRQHKRAVRELHGASVVHV